LAKPLIIVESPKKAETIGRFLGRRYRVAASMGHVRDLPRSKLGVDVEAGYEPQYITIRGKGKTLAQLRKEAAEASRVLLATDPDREGEAISWHLTHALDLDPQDEVRVVFNEITDRAVKNALKKPRALDMNLVNAQQARRVVDRLVGYSLSPLLWRKVRRGLSAGRVQSVAVRLIVDREEEREAFQAEEYWSLTAEFASPEAGDSFTAKLQSVAGHDIEVGSQEEMERLLADLPREGYFIESLERSERKRYPSAPFTTSSLQQAASRRLGFRVSRTMRVAQQLYEGISVKGGGHVGLITYMRTDSTRIAPEALSQAQKFIEGQWGEEYSQPRRRRKSARGAQEAHEAIRPTDVSRRPGDIRADLTPDQYRLYKLIWERFLASQMTPAVLDEVSVVAAAEGYRFTAKGSAVKFPGFMTLWLEDRKKDDEAEERMLPPGLRQGQALVLGELMPRQHFTQPPPRFTEASLVEALEREGIGRPSTYAPIIETIQKRGYVMIDDKKLAPTELGRAVTHFLKEHFADVVDVSFTANMEERLDSIEKGLLDWRRTVDEYYRPFSQLVSTAEKEADRVELPVEETDVECEKCGSNMVVKHGRYGRFLACPNFPECRNTKPYLEKTGAVCPECGADIVQRRSKKGRVFYGCSAYPECEFVSWNKPTSETCPECGAFMVRRRSKGKGTYHQCSRPSCRYEVVPGKAAARVKASVDRAED